MNNILNIITLFKCFEERTIENLSSFYNNSDLLKEEIKKCISSDLSDNLIKGKSVLFKPNWVKHSLVSTDELCLRTNDNFVLAALKVILEMRPSNILIGDAPIQGCNWNKMISSAFIDAIAKLSQEYRIHIEIKDFRRRTYNFINNETLTEINPLSEYLIFNLGEESLLEPITNKGKTLFRVTNYDPDRMASAHSKGIHKYCITKEFFNADVIISLPKIKTHQKTGITGALKNLVGINGDKDFLPHHRIGGTKHGGDCYPGSSILRFLAELSLDAANRVQGKSIFWFWQKLSSILWRLSIPGPEFNLAAGWYGNDTTWRMVMDLNKIAEYGKSDGTISKNPQRKIYSLCDGIIAGQGDGPLDPEPLPLGLISFADCSIINDWIMAILIGLPVNKIPILKNHPSEEDINRTIKLNGKHIKTGNLQQYKIKARAPIGWSEYLKLSK